MSGQTAAQQGEVKQVAYTRPKHRFEALTKQQPIAELEQDSAWMTVFDAEEEEFTPIRNLLQEVKNFTPEQRSEYWDIIGKRPPLGVTQSGY